MANFTIRIELLGDPGADVYEGLHARMEKGGFLQTISEIDAQGNMMTLTLPHATYFGSVGATAIAVRDWARDQAQQAWGRSVIFVADTSTWARGES